MMPTLISIAVKAAISGFVIGGALGGLAAIAGGGSVWKGILEGAVYGAIDGAALAIVIFGLVTAVKAVAAVRAANAARTARSVDVGNAASAENAAVQPDYAEYARQATHNNASDKVVIGKYESGGANCYTTVAEANKATYFSMDNWDDVANIIGRDNMWNINQAFLQQQVALGKTFYASHSITSATNSFLDEILFLKSLGIMVYPI